MTEVTTITQKGQVTIPLLLRKKLGLSTGQKVRFLLDEAYPEKLVLEPVDDFLSLKGSFKSKKKYSKSAAREAYIKDVVSGKI